MKKLFAVVMTLMCSMVVGVSFMTSCAYNANKDANDTISVDSVPVDTLYEAADTIPVDSIVWDVDAVEAL